jgi:tape measure domain-containing protein
MSDGKIEVDLEVNSDGAVASAEAGAHKIGGKFSEVMTGAARRIGEAFVDLGARAVTGLADAAQAGVDFNAKMEQYETAFTTLLGNAEEAQKTMAAIREDAARTPFDVDSLTQANQALIAAGVDSGRAQKDVLNLANAIAAVGGGSAELSRMAANMQQIRNTGKATAMDIRQFANAGINIYAVLADYLGVTAEEAAELDVTYDDLTAAMEKAASAGGMYAGALEAQSQTFTGQMSTLKDNLTQLGGALTQDLFSSLASTFMPQLMDWVHQLLEAAESGGIQGALQAAGRILGEMVKKFLQGLPKMLDTGLKLLEEMLRGLIRAIPKIIPVVLQVVSDLIQAFVNHLPELLELGVELLVSIVTGLLEAIPWMLTQIPLIIAQIFMAFQNADWGEIGHSIIEGIWNGVLALADWLTNGVVNLVRRIFGLAVDEGKGELDAGISSYTPEVTSHAGATFTGGGGRTIGGGSVANGLSSAPTRSSRFGGGGTIIVPVQIDGQEVARATAYPTSQQLAWEELS